MTAARLSSGFVQTVHSGTSGSRVRMTSGTAQFVMSGIAARVRVSSATVQVVSASIGSRVRVSSLFAQAVHHGIAGSRVRLTSAYIQSLYTIGVPDTARQLAWTFDFDGHTFYVLDLGARGSLLYDLTTGQWTHFETRAYDGHWNMKNGFHWRSGRKVIGGSILGSVLYEMVPDVYVDEGFRPVMSEVRGAIFTNDINHHKNYALRLIGSAGRTADDVSPVLRMQFSDDQAVTWSREYSVTLTTNTKQRIEWRSLGAFAAPGRIFRLYDEGGVKFIAYVMAEVDGEA